MLGVLGLELGVWVGGVCGLGVGGRRLKTLFPFTCGRPATQTTVFVHMLVPKASNTLRNDVSRNVQDCVRLFMECVPPPAN